MATANDKPDRGDDPIFGRIEVGVAYHKSQLIRRLGISDRTYRKLVMAGLPTCQIGAFVWILSDDILDLIRHSLPIRVKLGKKADTPGKPGPELRTKKQERADIKLARERRKRIQQLLNEGIESRTEIAEILRNDGYGKATVDNVSVDKCRMREATKKED